MLAVLLCDSPNDDFGRDYVVGAKDVLGAKYDSVIKAVSYEVTDATPDLQLIQLLSTKKI